MANDTAEKKKFKYVGPYYKSGLVIDGISMDLKKWPDKKIEQMIIRHPKIQQYFSQ